MGGGDRGKRGIGRKFAEFCVVLKNNCGNIWKFKIFLVTLFAFALNDRFVRTRVHA